MKRPRVYNSQQAVLDFCGNAGFYFDHGRTHMEIMEHPLANFLVHSGYDKELQLRLTQDDHLIQNERSEAICCGPGLCHLIRWSIHGSGVKQVVDQHEQLSGNGDNEARTYHGRAYCVPSQPPRLPDR